MFRVSSRWFPAVLLAAALLLYLPFLGTRDIVTGHEARVAQTARLMALSWPWQSAARVRRAALTDVGGGVLRLAPTADGQTVAVNPWLVPVLQGGVRLQKPPLPYWCAAVLLKFKAGPRVALAAAPGLETCSRLVPALLGALCVVLVYGLARRLIGRTGARAAGLIWLSSYVAFDEFRLAMPDPYLAFFTLLCLTSWVRSVPAHVPAPLFNSRSREAAVVAPRRTAFVSQPFPFPAILLVYVSLALGVLAKGPLIFLHVGIAIAAFHYCYRCRLPGRPWHHAIGTAVFFAAAVPWFAYVYRHVPDAVALWRYESVGELSANTENPAHWWYYLPTALWVALPWTPLWLAGLVLPLFRPQARAGSPGKTQPPAPPAPPDRPNRIDRRNLFPVLWYAATLLFFSFVHQKKPTYLLPVLPAQVLLTARAAVALLAHARLTWARGGRWRAAFPAGRRDTAGYLLGAQSAVGAAFAVALPVLMRFASPETSVSKWVFAAVISLAAGAVPVWALLRRPRQWLTVQAAGFALLVALFQAGFVTPRDNHRSAGPACAVATQMLRRPEMSLLSRSPMLADEAAVYLPLEAADGEGGAVGHHLLLIFDDQEAVKVRSKGGKAAASFRGPVPTAEGEVSDRYRREWDDWIGSGRIVAASRVPVPGAEGDVRWKLFELTVDRRAYAGSRELEGWGAFAEAGERRQECGAAGLPLAASQTAKRH